jgi:RHS repeat-associated protein
MPTRFDDLKIEVFNAPVAMVVQENSYYPFGLNMRGLDYTLNPVKEDKYTFQGKEKQTDFGLNLFDFEARMYDGYGRITTIDPHAERYHTMSGYSFLVNNPLRVIDPTGMDTTTVPVPSDGSGNKPTPVERIKQGAGKVVQFLKAAAKGEIKFELSFTAGDQVAMLGEATALVKTGIGGEIGNNVTTLASLSVTKEEGKPILSWKSWKVSIFADKEDGKKTTSTGALELGTWGAKVTHEKVTTKNGEETQKFITEANYNGVAGVVELEKGNLSVKSKPFSVGAKIALFFGIETTLDITKTIKK